MAESENFMIKCKSQRLDAKASTDIVKMPTYLAQWESLELMAHDYVYFCSGRRHKNHQNLFAQAKGQLTSDECKVNMQVDSQ